MAASTQNRNRGQEGIAIIYVAFFMLVSLWFVSLAIDAGKLMAAKTELQAAADAAALAGASAIDPLTAEIIPALAKERAAAAAASNNAYQGVKTAVVINPDVDVEFPPGGQRVKVSVYRNSDHGNPVLLHFAQTLGIPSIGVTADATAEVGVIVDLCEGIAPFAPEVLPNGADFSKDCNSEYTLKLGAGNGTEGNYQLLSYPDCPESVPTKVGGGGDAVNYYIVNGWDCCFKMGDMIEVDTEPGNKVGPVRSALRERFDADTNNDQGICYEDYLANGGSGDRVFLCPVIEDFTLAPGKHTVKVVKFAAFFLKDRPSGNMVQQGVTGQFIDYIAVGQVSSTPPVPSSLYGIHLIE